MSAEMMASDESTTHQAVSHGNTSQQPSCPAFLSKLWLLVEDENTDDFIHWSEEGNSFIVRDQAMFAQALLPQFFKHNNMASFIRQLNMYGFRKKAHLDEGALKTERTDIEFQHPHFLKGEIRQLELIKRKVSSKDDAKGKGSDVSKILSDVRDVKGKQDTITAKLESIKSENTALWREVVTLRQRHEKQQKIVNRLIHFLISLVQPKVAATKRRQVSQLMIQGFPDGTSPSKVKYARTLPASATIDELPVRGHKQDINTDFLSFSAMGDNTSISDIIGNAPSQSKVTELLADDDLLPQSTPDIPVSTTTTLGADFDSVPLSEDDLLPSDLSNIPDAAAANSPNVANIAGGVNVAGSPAADIPVVSATSPNISYPMTPLEQSSWEESDPENTPADVFGVEDTGIFGDVDASGGFEGEMIGGPDDGQYVVITSTSPNGGGGLPSTMDGSSSRVMVQRMLSHEEQRQDIGEQLNTVQSNLQDFQQLIASNPSLTIELGNLLGDFQGFFEEPETLTIPDTLSNAENLETEENGSDTSYLVKAPELPSMGNELVTYKTPSSLSLSSFMAEDEDSLLRSLDDDSDSLRQQKECDVTFEL